MMLTRRVSLLPSMSVGYGYLLNHCGKRQQVKVEELLEDGDYWCCCECNKPLIIRLDGRIYEVGSDITI